MKKYDKTLNCNLNTIEGLNNYLNNSAIREVKEALRIFAHDPNKRGPNTIDEFILMTKEQVQLFQELNTNPNIKIKIEWCDDRQEQVYCYILYRTPKKKQVR